MTLNNTNIRLINADCIEYLPSIETESIGCVITDPPYNYEFMDSDWNNEEIKRRTNRIQQSKTLVKNIPYGSGLSGGVRNKNCMRKIEVT